ncbi:CheR family methyltransferase [Methylophaga sp. OBS3]|uniref:CheR family methyltransferase n=1 Tax=Methylophaga sp. OBS3 TaxID=2991934 RepID=UPI00225B0E7F|nr:protein-glutamate O-methyltransferase CheR [Methylophaga sp. OBS3]MCX4190720.1 protein-glutamate O-methyltransferase CheR [Methylophaga sp. OBS3]
MLQSQDISQSDYEKFRLFLEQACGILLGDGKQYLIISRLTKLLRDEKIGSVSELLTAIQMGTPAHLRNSVIDAMTTNETSWFRDGSPYFILEKNMLAELEQTTKAPCRIWSSACSSGQEPYTISMLITEYLRKNSGSKLSSSQIVATDISTKMLTMARLGLYETNTLDRGLSLARKQQFFKAVGEQWEISQDVKQRVQFREQNLLQSYTGLGRFDVIFCRNVLIYFSAQRKSDILTRMAQALNPGGYLFLGASETISGYSDAFEIKRYPEGVVYQRR